jgi:hypothetical protein
MKGFIYITTNKINGLKYIGKKYYFDRNGKTTNWKDYLGSSKILKEDIKILGVDNFERIIIAEAENAEALNKLEIDYINALSAVDSSEYYNLSNGVDKFYTNEESITRGLETRRKWSEDKKFRVSQKLKDRFLNMSEDVARIRSEKISKAHKDNPKFKKMRSEVQKKVCKNMTPEAKERISTKRKISINGYYKNWSDEERSRHIEIRKNGVKRRNDNIFVNVKNVETGEIFNLSVTEAKQLINCTRSVFSKLKNGKHDRNNTWKQWTILQ